jgi:hypothetical protein
MEGIILTLRRLKVWIDGASGHQQDRTAEDEAYPARAEEQRTKANHAPKAASRGGRTFFD